MPLELRQMHAEKNEFNQPIGFSAIDWSAPSLPPRTPMQGRYCRLEALDISKHAVSLYETLCSGSPAEWTYLPYGPFQELASFKVWLQQQCLQDDPLFYTICDTDSGKASGLASYLRIDTTGGVIEVGHIHYSKWLQKTPMATEAMYLMMQRVFDELGYRRYEWKCDALNERSRSAALRLGFSFEGIFRQATMYKNRNRDTAWYSIIDSEWPRLKMAYEAWLAVDNFDDSGSQIKSLRHIFSTSC